MTIEIQNKDNVQLLNTAIIKSKEKKININFEKRLDHACQNPAIGALELAIENLSQTQSISRDQATIQIVEVIRELDSVWNDYIMLEGLGKLKSMLKKPRQQKHPQH